MELEVLFWALAFMVGAFVLGGAIYGIYQWLIDPRRRRE